MIEKLTYYQAHSVSNSAPKKVNFTIRTGKGMFYIAWYPVRRSAQSVLVHFTPLADLFIPTPTQLLWEAFWAAITRYSLLFQLLSR